MSAPGTGPRNVHEILPADQVARWLDLIGKYPEACYTVDPAGWFFGALRDADDVLRSSSLERLIDRLTARESYPGNPEV